MIRRPLVPFLFLLALILSFPPISSSQSIREKGDPNTPEANTEKTSLGGIQIHFVDMGQGQPVLFLHGMGGSWKDWAPTLPFLSRSHQVMAIDFPGFGESDAPEVDYSIAWLTEITEKFLQARLFDSVHVVGHSMGALVAINLAARPNSRVKKLVVVDAVGIGDKAEFLSHVLTKKIMGPESRWETIEGVLKEGLRAQIDDFIRGQKPKTSREFFESLPRSPFTDKAILPMTPAVQLSAGIMDFDIRPKLAKIKQPTLILWGAKDPVAPPQDALLLKNQIPQASLLILPGCGHTPMQGQPALFNQTLKQFLQAAESGSSR